jgi:hypothetical protein
VNAYSHSHLAVANRSVVLSLASAFGDTEPEAARFIAGVVGIVLRRPVENEGCVWMLCEMSRR